MLYPTLPTVIIPPEDMPVAVLAMLQATIESAWLDYAGDPNNPEKFWDFMTGKENPCLGVS